MRGRVIFLKTCGNFLVFAKKRLERRGLRGKNQKEIQFPKKNKAVRKQISGLHNFHDMDTSKKEVEDVYEILGQHQILLNGHVKVLLKKLGFSCLTTLSMISDVSELEKTVQFFFASRERLELMSPEEKLHLFGEVCSLDPTKFTFMPGEKFAILAAAEKSREILKQISLSKTLDAATSGVRKRPVLSSATTLRTTTVVENHLLQLCQPNKRPQRSTIVAYIDKWLRNTKYPINYMIENCDVSEETRKVTCKLCPTTKSFTIYTDAVGCWKMTSFVNHLRNAHLHSNHHEASVQPSTSTASNEVTLDTANQTEFHQVEEEDNPSPPSKRLRTDSGLISVASIEPSIEQPQQCHQVFLTPGMGVLGLLSSPENLTPL